MSMAAFLTYLEQDGIKVPENVMIKLKDILDPKQVG